VNLSATLYVCPHNLPCIPDPVSVGLTRVSYRWTGCHFFLIGRGYVDEIGLPQSQRISRNARSCQLLLAPLCFCRSLFQVSSLWVPSCQMGWSIFFLIGRMAPVMFRRRTHTSSLPFQNWPHTGPYKPPDGQDPIFFLIGRMAWMVVWAAPQT
jgi:hypothetical protein